MSEPLKRLDDFSRDVLDALGVLPGRRERDDRRRRAFAAARRRAREGGRARCTGPTTTTRRGGSGSGKGVVCNVSGSVRLGWCPSHGVLFVLVWSVSLGSYTMLLVLLDDASDARVGS
jgi:hypothetical protein